MSGPRSVASSFGARQPYTVFSGATTLCSEVDGALSPRKVLHSWISLKVDAPSHYFRTTSTQSVTATATLLHYKKEREGESVQR